MNAPPPLLYPYDICVFRVCLQWSHVARSIYRRAFIREKNEREVCHGSFRWSSAYIYETLIVISNAPQLHRAHTARILIVIVCVRVWLSEKWFVKLLFLTRKRGKIMIFTLTLRVDISPSCVSRSSLIFSKQDHVTIRIDLLLSSLNLRISILKKINIL